MTTGGDSALIVNYNRLLTVPGRAKGDKVMELETLSCNNCGAPLEVPPGANFVTCAHCGSRLAIKRTDNASYTEVLDQIGQRTERMSEDHTNRGLGLDRYRSYLLLLARSQLGQQFRKRLVLSSPLLHDFDGWRKKSIDQIP